MVDTSELENYLNDKACKEGDLVEITGEGSIEEKEDLQTHKKKKLLNLPIKLNGQRTLVYSPAKKAREILEKAFGTNTQGWVGKKFQVKFNDMTIMGKDIKVIKPVPITEKKV